MVHCFIYNAGPAESDEHCCGLVILGPVSLHVYWKLASPGAHPVVRAGSVESCMIGFA